MNYDFEEAFPHNGKASVPDPKIIFFFGFFSASGDTNWWFMVRRDVLFRLHTL
jgi:hypothetical protein